MVSEKAKYLDKASNTLSSLIARYGEVTIYTYPCLDAIIASSILHQFLLDNDVSFSNVITVYPSVDEVIKARNVTISIGIDYVLDDLKMFKERATGMIIIRHHRETDVKSVNDKLLEVYVGSDELFSTFTFQMLREIWVPTITAYTLPLISGLAYDYDRTRDGSFKPPLNGIADDAERRGIISKVIGLKTSEFESKNIVSSICDTVRPYLLGLTGDEEGVKKLLVSLGIKDYDIKITELPKEVLSKIVRLLIERSGTKDKVQVGWIAGTVYRAVGVSSIIRDIKDLATLMTSLSDYAGFSKCLTLHSSLEYYTMKHHKLLKLLPTRLKDNFFKFKKEHEKFKAGSMKIYITKIKVDLGSGVILENALQDHGLIGEKDLVMFKDANMLYLKLERLKRLNLNANVELKLYKSFKVDNERGYLIIDDINRFSSVLGG